MGEAVSQENLSPDAQDANESPRRQRVSDMPVQPVEGARAASVEEIARIIGQVGGALSLAIVRRMLNRKDVVDHVRRLRLAANLLEQRFL